MVDILARGFQDRDSPECIHVSWFVGDCVQRDWKQHLREKGATRCDHGARPRWQIQVKRANSRRLEEISTLGSGIQGKWDIRRNAATKETPDMAGSW